MIRFSKEKVLLFHKLITEETGGDSGVRDLNLLDSALENIYQTFDGQELYPQLETSAQKLYAGMSKHRKQGHKSFRKEGIYVLCRPHHSEAFR